MAVSKLAALCVFVALIFTCVWADASTESSFPDEVNGSDAAYEIKLDQLNSKIHELESRINEQLQELKSKDDLIAEKTYDIQSKTSSIESLQTQISSLQKDRSLDAEQKVQKAYAHAGELEKQINKLKKELKTQEREENSLSTKANEAEKKIDELTAKIENLQTINEQQKSQIRKTERALKVAEEEIMKAKFDATSKTKELMEVHGSWLPPWLARHSVQCQMLWNEHGKPIMDLMIQKAWEKNAQVGEWAKPHLETVKTKWIPAMKEQWLAIVTHVEPHFELLTTKAIEAYEVSKNTVTPHIVIAQEFVDPYYQEVKKHSKPHIDHVASVTKPHVDKVRTALKPYTKKVVHAYGKFLESATTYHHQMQGTVHELLERHELTRPLATKELVWFLASALLALPIIFLSRICSAIFCKKSKKPVRNAHTTHSRRKAKRVHHDK